MFYFNNNNTNNSSVAFKFHEKNRVALTKCKSYDNAYILSNILQTKRSDREEDEFFAKIDHIITESDVFERDSKPLLLDENENVPNNTRYALHANAITEDQAGFFVNFSPDLIKSIRPHLNSSL